ncbi:MAG: hypothetical protein Q7R73_04490 [bacterium]|nr:hypothetical protein [bacterium]
MLIGHTRQLLYLKKAAANGMLGHAYLFEGPKHVGKMTTALEWASSFFPSSERGFVGAGSHPDVIVLSKECHLSEKAEENENTIGIDDVHELRRLMTLSTRVGTHRIAIIDGAEDMQSPAQNALLKILEEPGAGKLFILVSHDASRLLPTILSRVVSMSFSYLSDADMQKYAKEAGVAVKDEKDLLFSAGGRPGVLARLVRDAEFRTEARERKKMLASLVGAPLFENMKVASVIAGDRDAESEFFFGFFRMLREELTDALERGEGTREQALLRNTLRIKRYMDTTNVNRRLALENVILEL